MNAEEFIQILDKTEIGGKVELQRMYRIGDDWVKPGPVAVLMRYDTGFSIGEDGLSLVFNGWKALETSVHLFYDRQLIASFDPTGYVLKEEPTDSVRKEAKE